jgi:hypothetical protein
LFFICWMKCCWQFSFDVHWNVINKCFRAWTFSDMGGGGGGTWHCRNITWVVTRMLEFNFYLWFESKPKLKDCDQILVHVVGIVWEQWMKGLRTCKPCKIWMLNIITRLNNTHDWASHGGWTPIQFLILPQWSKRKVCTKQATLVWGLGMREMGKNLIWINQTKSQYVQSLGCMLAHLMGYQHFNLSLTSLSFSA